VNPAPDRKLRILVYSLAGLLVGGQGMAVVTGRELWPFSPYPMYAEQTSGHTFRVIRLVGVSASRPSREIGLDSAWLRKALAKASRHPHAEKQLRRTVGCYLQKYGWTNPTDKTGPRLKAMRVYELVWRLRPDASNRDTPDQTRLLLEYPNVGGGERVASR
jgi:hypothetical protein